MQSAVGFDATIAKAQTNFAELERIIHENNIDPFHIFNLDESGKTPNRKVNGRIR